jgi:hypothetical protein
MTPEYLAFLARKAPRPTASGIEPGPMNPVMFDYQKDATAFCIRQGRAALFLDTGLGKTICELEFASQAAAHTGKPALILTPLAVARQIEREAARFGYTARVVRDQSEVRDGINICNYDRLDKLGVAAFGCVVLDESSILKSFAGATTRALIATFAATPFRLAATATPAPNDHMELGNHAEFLGIMTMSEMLIRWFINDTNDTGTWRLKRHGIAAFWDWVSSWARMAETPADLGYDGSRFVLPELKIIRHKVGGEVRPIDGGLFAADVSATNMFAIKRQTTDARADAVAALVKAEPDHNWVIWCDTDHESEALASRLRDAVEVRGSHAIERKEAALADFAEGRARQIISKCSITGYGLNWQHADRQAFVGRSFSYEAWYQAVRRSWRFGQNNPVHVHIAVAEGEEQIGRVIDRKAAGHADMKRAMAAAMKRNMSATNAVKVKYNPTHEGRLPAWL